MHVREGRQPYKPSELIFLDMGMGIIKMLWCGPNPLSQIVLFSHLNSHFLAIYESFLRRRFPAIQYLCVRLKVALYPLLFRRRKFTLIGHRAEISNAQFNYDSSLIATASMDQTARLWDTRTGQAIATLRGHEDEVLDVAFDYTGLKLATASADGAYVYCQEYSLSS